MKSGLFIRAPLSMAILTAFVAAAATNQASALPRRPGGSNCACACAASDNGDNIISWNSYDAHGLSCKLFNGATCNFVDPRTGGLRTGKLTACTFDGFTPYFIWSQNGGVTIYSAPPSLRPH
jgi:hypothetical protein